MIIQEFNLILCNSNENPNNCVSLNPAIFLKVSMSNRAYACVGDIV